MITKETTELLAIVESVNSRIQNLAASAEEMSASTTILSDTMEQVKEELQQLVDSRQ